MEFLPLSRRRSSRRNVPSYEELQRVSKESQNLIKYKYLLYISFLFGLVSTVPFYPRKKKRKERAVREKGRKPTRLLTSLFAFSLLLSSKLMLCLLPGVCLCVFFFLLFLFLFFVVVVFFLLSLFTCI